MKNQNNKNELKASVSEISGKNSLKLNSNENRLKDFDLSSSVIALSWPVAMYKFFKNRSAGMFR